LNYQSDIFLSQRKKQGVIDDKIFHGFNVLSNTLSVKYLGDFFSKLKTLFIKSNQLFYFSQKRTKLSKGEHCNCFIYVQIIDVV